MKNELPYNTDKQSDQTAHIIVSLHAFSSSNEQNMMCRDRGISKSNYQRVMQEPYDLFMLMSPKNVLPKTLMKRYNVIYMYMNYSNGLLNFKSPTSGQGERGRPE